MLRSLARTLVPVALAIAITSCGGDSDDDLTPSPSPQTSTPGAQSEATGTPGAQQTPGGDDGQDGDADGTYTVQPGDTLLVIAERFGITVDAIAGANGISDPDQIAVGQVLVIPDPE